MCNVVLTPRLEEMIIPPGSAFGANDGDDNDDLNTSPEAGTNGHHPPPAVQSDHPLSDGPDSAWSTYFKDNEVLLQIDRDVRRLCPDISFFQQSTEYPCTLIAGGDGDERRLHSRVTPSVLNSANVERKGLGLTKVWITLRLLRAYNGVTNRDTISS